METNISLPDSTCVRVTRDFQKRWSKFDDDAPIAALLSALFPFLCEPFCETMYGIRTFGLPAFASSVLAARMIHERYGKLPEFFFDELLTMGSMSTRFSVFIRDGKVNDQDDVEGCVYKELELTTDSVDYFTYLLDNIQVEEVTELDIQDKSEQMTVEPVDVTPEVQDNQGAYEAYSLAEKCKEPCYLCSVLASSDYTKVRLSEVERRLHCPSHLFDVPIPCRIFSSSSLKPEVIRVYGASFRFNPCFGLPKRPGTMELRTVRFHKLPRPVLRDKIRYVG